MPVEVLPELTLVMPGIKDLFHNVIWEKPILEEQRRTMKAIRVIYIAGPFRAKTQWGIMKNVRKAEDASLKLWKLGYAVICPHTMTQHFQDECPDEVWLNGCLDLLKRCDAIFLVEGWQESEGALAEYKLAQELGLVIIGNGNSEKTCPICGLFFTEVYSGEKCPRCKGG